MRRPHAITVELDDDALGELDRLCDHFGRSREHLVTTAVLRFVSEELPAPPSHSDELADLPPYQPDEPSAKSLIEADQAYANAFEAFIKVGEDAIERGETVSHEEMMARLKARFGRKHAA